MVSSIAPIGNSDAETCFGNRNQLEYLITHSLDSDQDCDVERTSSTESPNIRTTCRNFSIMVDDLDLLADSLGHESNGTNGRELDSGESRVVHEYGPTTDECQELPQDNSPVLLHELSDDSDCEIIRVVSNGNRRAVNNNVVSQGTQMNNSSSIFPNNINDQRGLSGDNWQCIPPLTLQDSAALLALSQRGSDRQSDILADDDDDVILGPIYWGTRVESTLPVVYNHNPHTTVYNIIDTNVDQSKRNEIGSLESDGDFAKTIIDSIEFLFRCPICYSTIARFKTAKPPSGNDRIIYSTKCGHMYCYECIEGVKKRRECPLCRKSIRDSKQFHPVYP
uniref:RING-type domain-containing protein n=2 Tax=Babesia bovis TaxID=5865 RepID=A7ASU1_BABBO|eukprot:XP_001609570.1 hypothetical protein [Babesia bovis T2Bo]